MAYFNDRKRSAGKRYSTTVRGKRRYSSVQRRVSGGGGTREVQHGAQYVDSKRSR